jgi:hypothetical protein
VSATVLVIGWALQRSWRGLVAASVALHLGATGLLFNAREVAAGFGMQLPAEYDALRRLRGWRDLGRQVAAVLASHPGLTLFADDRELLAALVYYVRPHPFDAAKWQLTSRVQDQWDLIGSLPRHLGGGFLLVSEHGLVEEMRPSFAEIERIGTVIIPLGGGAARTNTHYISLDFKGYRRAAAGMHNILRPPCAAHAQAAERPQSPVRRNAIASPA